jgi:hypothetical protein
MKATRTASRITYGPCAPPSLASLGIIDPVRPLYIEAALHRLWSRYETELGPYREEHNAA